MRWLRARILVVVALALLGCTAGAATIDVTTFDDITADNDNVCSIREAVTASTRASTLSARTNNRLEMDQFLAEIADPRNLERLQFAIEYYPRGNVQNILLLLRKDLEAHNPVDTGLLAEVIAHKALIDDLPDAKVYLADVEKTIDLLKRTMLATDAEIGRLQDRDDVDGCRDGSSFDTIMLGVGTYVLATEVAVGVRLTIQGVGETSIITGGDATRLFRVDNTLTLQGLRLTGGNAGTGNGGALFIAGSCDVQDVVFAGNTAASGGAVYVDTGGSLVIMRGKFIGNKAVADGGAIAGIGSRLELTDTTLGQASSADDQGNSAGGLGGALYFASAAEGGGTLGLERVSVINNNAVTGSALYVGGTAVGVSVANTTFGRNEAAGSSTIEIAASAGIVNANNITLVDNNAMSGTGGLRVSTLTSIIIANSVIAGNTVAASPGNDCDLPVVSAANFQHNYYADSVAGCPGDRWSVTAPLNTNYDLGAGQTVFNWLLQALDEAQGVYVPLYPFDVLDLAENRLVNRGAGTQEAFSCVENDQRGLLRATFVDADCDIGAVEYQIGSRVDDVLTISVNETRCLDVGANDVGDALYTPLSLEVIQVERQGTVAVIASADPAAYLAAYALRHPTLPVPSVVSIAQCPNTVNPAFSEAILFTPAPGFHGETNLTYALGWQTAPVAAPAAGTVSGIVHVTTESGGGITSASLGSFGPAVFIVLALLAGRWRVRGAGRAAFLPPVAGALLALAALAHAEENIIFVNSANDPVDDNGLPLEIPGDGQCTLREALATARNDQANLTNGDCLDGNEGPDIIEIRVPQITLGTSLTAWGSVTIRCPEDAATTCTIRRDPAPTARKFALINSLGSISISGMILENGDAQTGLGGAINSAGAVSTYKSIFQNNTARTGGAIFLRGVRGGLTVTDSTFNANASTGTGTDGGGAIATSAGGQHGVSISGSTFVGNSSIASAAALSLKTTAEVVIANSTFSGNSSTAGAGAIDVSGAGLGATLRNLTVVDNRSGLDPLPNPDVQRGAIEFSAGSVTTALTNSIVAANYDVANTVDANCGAGSYQASFNMFGESSPNITCTIGLAAGNNSALAAVVYDGSDATDTDYLAPLAPNGFSTSTHAFNNPGSLDGILVDAGSPAKLVATLEHRDAACARVDQRGKSRESGGRCDIGAFEYVQITAVADTGSNTGRQDRVVVVDVLANDVYENLDASTTNDIKLDCTVREASVPNVVSWVDASGNACIDISLGAATGTVDFLRKNNLDDLHVIHRIAADVVITVSMLPENYISGKFPDDYVPGWVWPSANDAEATQIANDQARELAKTFIVTEAMLVPGYVLRFDNGGVLTPLNTPIEISYVIHDNAGNVSSPAEVSITVANVPPKVVADNVTAPVGTAVVIDVLANDSDADATNTAFNGLDPATIKITSGGCKAVEDSSIPPVTLYWNCEFGRAIVDSTNGTIAWTPFNSFNPFTETITYQVSDYQGKDGTANLTIQMDRPVANGGAILGEDDLSDMLGIDFLGAAGHLFFVSLALSLLRRRR